jgi:hypothetical protein
VRARKQASRPKKAGKLLLRTGLCVALPGGCALRGGAASGAGHEQRTPLALATAMAAAIIIIMGGGGGCTPGLAGIPGIIAPDPAGIAAR